MTRTSLDVPEKIMMETTHDMHRVSDLWFEDGGLIIQADQSFFKIYKGILTAQSSVFKSLLDEGSVTMKNYLDGCHHFQVPDSASDMTYFLKAIFDPGFFEPAPTRTESRIITAVLRLSHKYDVQYLRRRALNHLSPAYPATFTVYETREKEEQTQSSQSFSEPTSPADRFALIHLATEVGAFWILPSEVYYCCRYDAATILNNAGPGWVSSILTASARLRSKHLALLHHLATPLLGNNCCSTSSTCALARVRLFMTRAAQCESDPLAPVTDAEWDFLSEQTCDQCLADTKRLFREWWLNIWDDIPDMLDLPTWEELEKLKEEDLAIRVGPPVIELRPSQTLSHDFPADSCSLADSDEETISVGNGLY